MRVSAVLPELEGKYYGTEVLVQFDGYQFAFGLWGNASGVPSARDLNDGVYDSHFESVETLRLAELIVDCLNRVGSESAAVGSE